MKPQTISLIDSSCNMYNLYVQFKVEGLYCI